MAKKVIQVPITEELLKELENVSKKQSKSRAEVIRQACQRYLKEAENEDLDELYRAGYKRIPEEPAVGEAQAAMAKESMPKEEW